MKTEIWTGWAAKSAAKKTVLTESLCLPWLLILARLHAHTSTITLYIVSAYSHLYIEVVQLYSIYGKWCKSHSRFFYFTLSFKLTLKWLYIISKGQPFSNVLQTKTIHLTVFPLGNKLSFSKLKKRFLEYILYHWVITDKGRGGI